MTAGLLRRAADKIRETAQRATPGPWWWDDAGDLASPGAKVVHQDGGGGFRDADRDGDHVALWAPDAALLVAKVLDQIAADMTAGPRYSAGEMEDHYGTTEFALARRILGEDA